jgi:hypothetical protein
MVPNDLYEFSALGYGFAPAIASSNNRIFGDTLIGNVTTAY